jgi:two-component system sensor histidine kinase RegB
MYVFPTGTTYTCQNSRVDTPTASRSTPRGDNGLRESLRLLFWLRIVAIVSQTLVIVVVHYWVAGPLPLHALAVPIGALALWNVLNYKAVHTARGVTPIEFTLHIGVDIVAFTTVLYLTGGPTNPFVSLYLVPIALAAISLPAAYAWLVGAACAAGYSLLWWRSVPLPSAHAHLGGDFDLHLIGMWINFVVAASLIVLFVGRMARLIRERDRALAELREAALRDQQIVELGTLAAGTAHEINTPLATLALLIEELDESVTDPAQKVRLEEMMAEIETINARLNRIAVGVGADRSSGARPVALKAYIDELMTAWAQAHPNVKLDVKLDMPDDGTRIVAEATIEQAIRNVLDNAAHATLANGCGEIDVVVAASGTRLDIAVVDRGSGLDPAIRDDVGLKIVSTKERGLGIGLLLSRAALQRFGGRLELKQGSAGGVEAHILLPLDELLADAG